MSDSSTAVIVVALAATYLTHSTLLLLCVWTLARFLVRQPALLERFWRYGAVLGLLTAPAQLWVGSGWQLTLPKVERAETVASARFEPASKTEENNRQDASRTRVDANGAQRRAVHETVHPSADRSTATREPASMHARRDAEVEVRPVENHPVHSSESAIGGSPRRSFPSRIQIAAIGVGLLIALGLLRMLVQELLLRRRLAAASTLERGSVRRELDQLLQKNGVRRHVRLLVSDQFTGPAACGVFSWTILLPRDINDRVERDELRGLLLHELAHLARGDTRWLLIGRLLTSCLWFQPLNVLARRRWQAASEYLCDDWTVNRGVAQLTLARVLTKVLEWKLHEQRAAAMLGAGGGRSSVAGRIRNLVNGTRAPDVWVAPRRRFWLKVAVLCAGGLVVVGAPGFALPTARERLPKVDSISEQVVDASWRDLERELSALHADLETVSQLTVGSPTDVRALTTRLEEQAARLAERSSRLRSLAEQQRRGEER